MFWTFIDWEFWFGEPGGTTAHMQSVEASHYWNMEYGRGDLDEGQFLDYYQYSETTAGDLIASGQNDSPQAVRRYWELMETYLLDVSPRAAAIATTGIEAAIGHEGGTNGKRDFPWWILLGGIAVYIWRR
jgi:hypothetical protein